MVPAFTKFYKVLNLINMRFIGGFSLRVLGIHDGHNASICLLEDGEIKYLLQEERLTNKKNYFGFPEKSVSRMFEDLKIGPDDIDWVAMGSQHVPFPFTRDDLLNIYEKASSLQARAKYLLRKTPIYSMYKEKRRKDRISHVLNLGFDEKKVLFVDHHLCHASSAYFGSPWRNEKVLVMTQDGSGDDLCSTVYIGENGQLEKIAETKRGDSVGDLYARTTFMMGFVPLEHEYKLMGMAPYSSEYSKKIGYETYKQYLKLSESNPLIFERTISEPTHMMYPRLRKDTELMRFDSICAGLQQATEEILTKWVDKAIKKTGISTVALAGGTFMNVKADKSILELDSVEKLFVFPSCGDESNCIGAAFNVYAQKREESGEEINIKPLRELYHGPDFSDADVESALKAAEKEIDFEYEKVSDPDKAASELILNGEIVARCKGKLEWGARALGNRSILADPSDLSHVRVINEMIKSRDFWMPFAPVMMVERADEYIINPKQMPAPYMIMAFDTTDKRGEFVSATHQYDFTARPQIIEKDWNPGYHSIVENFSKERDIGVLLNTSFNLHGFPIAFGPEEAMWVFKKSGLKNLELGNYMVSKRV